MKKCVSLFLLICLHMAQFEAYQVSILTSVYNGDAYIEQFLEDSVKQSIFPQAELILVNANSPGNEEPIIKKYQDKYPNIKYFRLKEDPGLFAVYNYAAKQATSDLLTIASLDNRRNPKALEREVQTLKRNPEIDLVYQDYILSLYPNETWETHRGYAINTPDFKAERMDVCLPGPQPTWRKSLHQKFGWFDESYKFSGDWELWCRAASQGAQFKKIPGFSGIYYYNPDGLKISKNDAAKREAGEKESTLIVSRYKPFWEKTPEKMLMKNRQLVSGFGTHIYPLLTVLVHTEGPVLEVGTGDYSTPLLHAHCSKNRRPILSVDTSLEWLNTFADLTTPWHQFKYIPPNEYKSSLLKSKKWSVVFIDGAPAERRIEDIKHLRNQADIFVLHDAEDPQYGYQPLVSSFTYHYLYDRYLPHTMIVSDKIDVSQFFK